MSGSDEDLDAALQRARELRVRKDYAGSLAAQKPLFDVLPRAKRDVSYVEALLSGSRLNLWNEVETIARRAVADFPDDVRFLSRLGEALMHLGRRDEAMKALEHAVRCDTTDSDAWTLLRIVRMPAGGGARQKARPWPKRVASFDKPRDLIRRYLIDACPAGDWIRPDTVFMTLGSCFADELARHLGAAGHDVDSESLGEEINSTYANRYLLDWVEHGVTDGPTAEIGASFGPGLRERLRLSLAKADAVVLTIGVAPAFFDPATGAFAMVFGMTSAAVDLRSTLTMRTTTVAENVENIKAMLASIRRLSRCRKIVLTVSPVPLAGTTEFPSAIVADCVSKSTLRVACHEVLAGEGDDVVYWPSFEIVRWLGAHFGPGLPRAFGADDGNARHVSSWLVKLITELFIERFSGMPDPAALSDAYLELSAGRARGS